MRAFVAILLEAEARQYLAEAQKALPADQFRLAAAENLHVTLKFLGNVNDAELPRLCTALAGAPRLGVLRLRPQRVASLRSGLVMAELAGDAARAAELAETIETACEPLGFAREKRAFRPHVTLARPRRRASVRPFELVDPPTVVADSFALMRSELGADKPRYTTLATFPMV